MTDKTPLLVELLLLFVGMPLLYMVLPWRFSPLPALWLAALYCVLVLHHAPAAQVSLWNAKPLASSLTNVLVIFAVVAVLLTIAVWRLRPNLLFGFVRTHPAFWAVVMVLYPILSVYPQGIIYRAFFVWRYRTLFPSPVAIIVASAAAFAFSHIIFRSSWSVLLTFAAGLLFAWRYSVTDSLPVSSLEHALYGCFMFTVGLGGLFYHGTGAAAFRR